MTSGGDRGTSGGRRRARLAALAAFAALGLGFAVVNALSEIDDRSRSGDRVASWEPWTWELTSFIAFLIIAPLVFIASQRLTPPHLRWPASLPLLALLSLPFSAAHVALMIALRHAIYAMMDERYVGTGGLLDVFVYEYRKDLLTYAALLVLPHVAGALLRKPKEADAPAGDFRIEVRDGSRTIWLAPAELDWAQAAGNYVELHGAFGTLLHRRTLAALEQQLAPHGFVRIHRSRIVRAAAVSRVETRPAGDFDVGLSSGEVIGGSRRFRANLA